MMQSNNDTILSLVRVAKQLDDAGLYQQSDRVYDTLMRVAQISEELKKGWGLESGLSSFIKKFIDTKSEVPNMKARDSAIDKIITEYSTYGKIPSEFVDLFLKSSKFRSDLLSILRGHDFLDRYELMGPREAQNPWIEQFPTLIEMTERGSGGIQEIDTKINGLERQLKSLVKSNPPPAPSRYQSTFSRRIERPSPEKLEAYREINEIREAIETLEERRQEKLSNIERLKRNQATFEGLKTDRKQAVSEMLKQYLQQILHL